MPGHCCCCLPYAAVMRCCTEHHASKGAASQGGQGRAGTKQSQARGWLRRFVSRPEVGMAKGSSDRQLFFLNGRPVDLPKVGARAQLLPAGARNGYAVTYDMRCCASMPSIERRWALRQCYTPPHLAAEWAPALCAHPVLAPDAILACCCSWPRCSMRPTAHCQAALLPASRWPSWTCACHATGDVHQQSCCAC